jgi:2-keto-4-pentenoate hydratase/2-oxohepta-3-ene-1,7-dioic acid hydratase in catechol pathway
LRIATYGWGGRRHVGPLSAGGKGARTRDFIFGIPQLIEAVPAGIMLAAGDIIATGTPSGAGIGFDPPRDLKPGDRVRIHIDGIGMLENPVH